MNPSDDNLHHAPLKQWPHPTEVKEMVVMEMMMDQITIGEAIDPRDEVTMVPITIVIARDPVDEMMKARIIATEAGDIHVMTTIADVLTANEDSRSRIMEKPVTVAGVTMPEGVSQSICHQS